MDIRVLKYDPQRLHNSDGKAQKHRGWNSDHRRQYLEAEYAIIDLRRRSMRRVRAVLRLYGGLGRSSTTWACFWDHLDHAQGSTRTTWGSHGVAAFQALSAAGMTFWVPQVPDTKDRGLKAWDGNPEELMDALAQHQGLRPGQYYVHAAHP